MQYGGQTNYHLAYLVKISIYKVTVCISIRKTILLNLITSKGLE